MLWAIKRIDQLRNAVLLITAVLALANLTLGPDSLATRLTAVLAVGLVAPFAYFGMRWILKLQIWQHGLRPWIVHSATAFFYFFGLGAVAALVLLAMNIGAETPLAVTVIAPAVISFSAADTIRREQNLSAGAQEAT